MRLKRYLISGLLLWIPILVTIVIIEYIVRLMDKSMGLLPTAYQPDQLLGVHVPGISIVFAIVIVLATGFLAANFLGRRIVKLGESLVEHIPVVRTIYRSIKQVLETIFTSTGESFRKVLIVEYPRKGLWSIAFQTGESSPVGKAVEDELITVYLPTTPNPTSGFLIMVPREDVVELDMSVEQALKFIISLGIVMPGEGKQIPTKAIET